MHASEKHAPYKQSGSIVGHIVHSGSSRKLVVEKVKPPLQKNNYVTNTSSPRQPTKLMLRQSKKRDGQSSADHQAAVLNEKKMAFSQSV